MLLRYQQKGVLELQNFYLTSQILTMDIFWSKHKSGKPHYNRRYSFEVCIHQESDIRWRVDIVSASKERRLLRPLFWRSFKNLKGLDGGGFSQCVLPSPPPPSFSASTSVRLSRSCISYFCEPQKKKKHTPKNRWLGILRKVMLAWHAKGDAGARFREREMWDVWKSLFLEVVNKHAPMKKRKVKSKCSPITAELRRKMRKRDFLKIKQLSRILIKRGTIIKRQEMK